MRESIQVLLHFDDDHHLEQLEYRRVYTGP